MTGIVLDLQGHQVDMDLNDRGLAYGDGLFETLLVHAGKPIWWNEHWQRMLRGAHVLGIPAPDEKPVFDAARKLLQRHPDGVLKILLTRGSGGRGYAAPEHPSPKLIITMHDRPAPVSNPVCLRWCDTRLACQPLLAGIKHLNRLEQVLARNEWQDASIFDGLMCDTSNNVVCTTFANVFAKIGGEWFTPKTDQAGIAGIARAWVLKNLSGVQEAHLPRPRFEQVQAIFICNAVRGILEVNRFGAIELPADPDISDLQNRLAMEQPAFAMGEHSGS